MKESTSGGGGGGVADEANNPFADRVINEQPPPRHLPLSSDELYKKGKPRMEVLQAHLLEEVSECVGWCLVVRRAHAFLMGVEVAGGIHS